MRPSTGRRPYKLEQFRAGHWHWVGSTRDTGSGGSFRTVVRAGKGSKLRVYANREQVYSPILVVR